MKKLVAILLCSCLCFSLAACSNGGSDDAETTEATISENGMKTIECKYYDVKNEVFTDQTLITLNVPSNYAEVPQESLVHQKPIYQIGEFKTNAKSIIVYQYLEDNFKLEDNTKLSVDPWVMSTAKENYMANFYTKVNDTIIGLSITNLDKSEMTQDNALAALAILLDQESITIQEEVEPTSMYAKATLDEPANIGDWISIRMHNPISNQDEPMLFSLSQLHEDYTNDSEIEKYNNIGNTKVQNEELETFNEHHQSDPYGDMIDMVYTYSCFYPSTWTSNNGVVENPVISIEVCETNDVPTQTMKDVNSTMHDFNDLYNNTAKIGEDYTNGLGVFTVSKSVESKGYLIKINTVDGPRYFTR